MDSTWTTMLSTFACMLLFTLVVNKVDTLHCVFRCSLYSRAAPVRKQTVMSVPLMGMSYHSSFFPLINCLLEGYCGWLVFVCLLSFSQYKEQFHAHARCSIRFVNNKWINNVCIVSTNSYKCRICCGASIFQGRGLWREIFCPSLPQKLIEEARGPEEPTQVRGSGQSNFYPRWRIQRLILQCLVIYL